MSERKLSKVLHVSVVAAREVMVTQYFLFVWQEKERIREQSKESKEDVCPPDTAACANNRQLTADSSSVLCSHPKRGGLRRQACIEHHTQEQAHNPWIRLPDTSPEQLPKIHHQHLQQDSTQLVNIHSKPSTMSDEENYNEPNGTATDITSDLSNNTPENTSETLLGSKKAPPVAPKPAWFRQSLRKIRDEQDQKKQAKPAEPRSAAGFIRSSGARGAAPAAKLSIKQKIHSFETFSSPEGLEKGDNRRSVTPSTSLHLVEKETRSHPASHESCGRSNYEIPSNQSAPAGEADSTVPASPSAFTSSTSEVWGQTAKSHEDEPSSILSPTDLPPSDAISTDLDSGINDCHTSLAQDDRSVSSSKLEAELERVDLSRSTEEPSFVTSERSSQDDGEGPPEGAEGYGAQSQEKLLSTTESAVRPTDSNSLRGLEEESLVKILAFSNQVSQALMRSPPTYPCHGNPRAPKQDEAVDLTNPEEPEPAVDSADRGFSLSLATLRECTIERGEGASHNEAAVTSACAHSVISAIPSQEIQRMIQEVKALDDETLKQLVDIHVVILHKEEGTGLGFSIAGGSDLESKALTVHRVFPSGLAAQEGTIQKGDEVLSINGQTLRGVTHADATAALRQARSLKLAVVVVCKRAGDEEREAGGCKSEELSPGAEEQGAPVRVELEKGVGGVGFTLEGGKGSIQGDRPLVINRIFTGGAAEQSGLQCGDELQQVQEVILQDMTRFEAWNMIKALPEGPVTVIIRRRLGNTE